ncbi:bloom syndrome protein [Capronia coronata CBS 617.96]|uniref:DNA 3'-5' helicase n=1 Tax=Capronia coronata CBS 617.96 TaxID=1182541 RepID=W9YML8_9EURO|nr:bloom syndrome protein [Capronia coronata CBS 617.96]EXJ90900.1 bloom syndrome protein [Capronia coronata CBS 617.96]
MTRNNLSRCLAWLLQNPHSFGSLTHLSVVADAGVGEDDGPVLADDEMARLQLAPQIAPRTKLFSQLNQNIGLPTPDPSRASEAREATPRRARQNLPDISAPQPSPRPRTPVTTFDDIQFDDSHDILDIDEIDLTGGDLTTSSFSEFGPPTRLWREESASRIEPLPKKKGKKRKSEEFEQDLFSPSSTRSFKKRIDKRGTPASYPFHTSQPEPVVEDNKRSVGALSPSKTRSTKKALKDEDTLPDIDIVANPISPLAVYGTPKVPRTQPTSRASRTQKLRNVVLDSDEEDNDDLDSKPKLEVLENTSLGSERIRYHDSRDSQTLARPSNDSPISLGQEPVRGMSLSPRESRAGDPRPTPSGQSSSRREEALQGSCSSADSAGPLSHPQKRIVSSFVVNGREQCKALLERLEKSKKTVNREIMDEMCEFKVASDLLKDKKRTIESKITATTQLLEEHSAISKLRDQRKRMLERRDQLAEAGHEVNPDDPENVLVLLCMDINRVKHEIEAREVMIFKLLQQAGVSTSSGFTEQAPSRANLSHTLLDETPAQQVLVASTPKVPQQVSPNSRDLAHLSTQSIVQTPFAKRSDMNGNLGTFIPTFSPGCSPSRPAQSAMPPPSARLFQPTPHITESPSRNRTALYNDNTGDERGFSRTMGSPQDFSFEEDDFDDDDMDDEEMYKAVEEFEQNMPAFKATTPYRADRAALCEVSDNVRRVSPKRSAVSQSSFSNSALMQHPWSKDVASALKKRFHLHGFRHNQLEAINATLSGKDAFVLMPTGGGKSLCYQLPSIVHSGHTRGVTIVISPLLSLMQDQVDHLKKLHIQAFLFNGETTAQQKAHIFQALKNATPHEFIQLLYVTPEMVSKSQAMMNAFEDLHRRRLLARIVIDEAHCVSQWGHDFRPDYKALGEFRSRFEDVPIMALTATATENVKFDVMQCLSMENCEVFTQSFNRPNLTYEVRPKGKGKAVLEGIADLINTSYRGQAGIVYCLSRKNCEQVAEQLRKEYNIEAHHYHAGLPSKERIDIQKQWQAGNFKVIVATIAFGMGIDKANVRFVVHHTIPKSLEGYYQETGRAGRDGNKSGCYLYYGYGDTASLKHMIDNGDGSYQQKEHQKQLLRSVVQFCENRSDCRRMQVLDYFNERFDPRDCRNGCDNCASSSTFETHDFSEHAKNAIRLVQKVHRDEVTVLHCADVYRGAKPNKKMLHCGHHMLPQYGLGSDLARGDVERLFYRLISEDALLQYNKKNDAGFSTQYVRVGPKSRDLMEGRRPLKIQVLVSPRRKPKTNGPAQKSRTKANGKSNKTPIDEYPASTNVSSPLQPRSRRKLVRRDQLCDSSEEECAGQTSEDEDYFVSHRDKERPPLGPPITADDDIGSLNQIHQHILEDFVEKAKREIERQVIAKDLRQKPVTDRILRQIAIQFPQSEEELQEMTGLNPEMFRLLGPPLLRLITAAYDNYEAMMRAQEGRPDDPNHQTVVEISDDDGEAEVFSQSDSEPDESENSHYFSVPDQVRQFNEQSKRTGLTKLCPPDLLTGAQCPSYLPLSPKLRKADLRPSHPRLHKAGRNERSRNPGRDHGVDVDPVVPGVVEAAPDQRRKELAESQGRKRAIPVLAQVPAQLASVAMCTRVTKVNAVGVGSG